MENEKKTFKERTTEAKAKAKQFWEDHKVTIIKGAIGAATIVAGYVFIKKAGEALESEYGDAKALDVLKELPESGIQCDDEELANLIKQECDWENTQAAIIEKFKEVDEICREHNITYDACTTFGTDEGVDSDEHYLGWMLYSQGTSIDGNM